MLCKIYFGIKSSYICEHRDKTRHVFFVHQHCMSLNMYRYLKDYTGLSMYCFLIIKYIYVNWKKNDTFKSSDYLREFENKDNPRKLSFNRFETFSQLMY